MIRESAYRPARPVRPMLGTGGRRLDDPVSPAEFASVARSPTARWGLIARAAILALAHGVDPVLPAAFVVGVLTALLLRRSGSIWPGVVLHGVVGRATPPCARWHVGWSGW